MGQGPNNERQWQQVQQELRASQTLATAGQHSAAIMHEINNPLESIVNLAYLVKEGAENPDTVREYMTLIEEELANLVRIARQTLSFYKPSGTLQAFDFVPLAESALRLHGSKLSARKIQITKDLVGEAKVRAHAGEMLQVLSNVILNAIDALPMSGVLRMRVWKCPREVHVVIADNGHGIADDALGRIFEPFVTYKENGTGLGLSISKSIVESHRGRIGVRSSVRPGRTGTVFRISLPLEPATTSIH